MINCAEIVSQIRQSTEDINRNLLLLMSDNLTDEQQIAVDDSLETLNDWETGYLHKIQKAFIV
ncbi:MAG: hypothetical protein ACUZ9M_00860 [Candidatus Scalindua sp.]